LQILPRTNPPPDSASIAKREKLDFRIEIARWRMAQAEKRTRDRRPDLWAKTQTPSAE